MDNPNNAAFPYFYKEDKFNIEVGFGLSKREYFAGLAMQGILASAMIASLEDITRESVLIADQLLLALEQNIDNQTEEK